jgi:hypothetical protein
MITYYQITWCYKLITNCTVQSMVQGFNENTSTLIVLYDALIINCVACIVAELQINAFFLLNGHSVLN